MKWKSFKQEKPLLGQRILVCDMDFISDDYKQPSFYVGFYELDEEGIGQIRYKNYYGGDWLVPQAEYNFETLKYENNDKLIWTSVPNLPEDK